MKNGGGDLSLEELPVDEYKDRIKKFKPQMEEDMCETTAMTNSINDLGILHFVHSLVFIFNLRSCIH